SYPCLRDLHTVGTRGARGCADALLHRARVPTRSMDRHRSELPGHHCTPRQEPGRDATRAGDREDPRRRAQEEASPQASITSIREQATRNWSSPTRSKTSMADGVRGELPPAPELRPKVAGDRRVEAGIKNDSHDVGHENPNRDTHSTVVRSNGGNRAAS